MAQILQQMGIEWETQKRREIFLKNNVKVRNKRQKIGKIIFLTEHKTHKIQ